MKTKSFAAMAGTAAVGLVMWLTPGHMTGQPMYDRIHVNLPYKIMLGDKVLQPGDYTIQRLPDNGGARILLFYTDDGMKFETSVMTIPTLDPNTARDTKLILDHEGEDYYIHKIWVQGKDYGYELPRPKGLENKQHEAMTETAVSANTVETTPATPAETPAATAPTQTPAVNTQPEPQPVTAPTQPPTVDTTAQSTAPVQAAPPVATPADPNSANRSMPDQDATPAPVPAEMPKTAANWMMMLLSGGTLSGAGFMLRRKR